MIPKSREGAPIGRAKRPTSQPQEAYPSGTKGTEPPISRGDPRPLWQTLSNPTGNPRVSNSWRVNGKASTSLNRRSPLTGALGAEATAREATVLVTEPTELVTVTWKLEPLSAATAGATEKVGLVP
jgi:hypothetical protein